MNEADHAEIRRFGETITIEDRLHTNQPIVDRFVLVNVVGNLAQTTHTVLKEDEANNKRCARSLQFINRRVCPGGKIEEQERILLRLPLTKITWNELDADELEYCLLSAIVNYHDTVWHHVQIEFGLFIDNHILAQVDSDESQDEGKRNPEKPITQPPRTHASHPTSSPSPLLVSNPEAYCSMSEPQQQALSSPQPTLVIAQGMPMQQRIILIPVQAGSLTADSHRQHVFVQQPVQPLFVPPRPIILQPPSRPIVLHPPSKPRPARASPQRRTQPRKPPPAHQNSRKSPSKPAPAHQTPVIRVSRPSPVSQPQRCYPGSSRMSLPTPLQFPRPTLTPPISPDTLSKCVRQRLLIRRNGYTCL